MLDADDWQAEITEGERASVDQLLARFTPEQIARGALGAGVDALLVCSQTDLREALLAQLERLPDALLEPALRRMGAFKARHSGGRFASGATPPYAEHRALAASIEAAP